jgi:hypothetical protein
LFQINFFPDLTHVYFLPATAEVIPSLGQELPAFTDAEALS